MSLAFTSVFAFKLKMSSSLLHDDEISTDKVLIVIGSSRFIFLFIYPFFYKNIYFSLSIWYAHDAIIAPLSVAYFKLGIIAILLISKNLFLSSLLALTPPDKTSDLTSYFKSAFLVWFIK